MSQMGSYCVVRHRWVLTLVCFSDKKNLGNTDARALLLHTHSVRIYKNALWLFLLYTCSPGLSKADQNLRTITMGEGTSTPSQICDLMPVCLGACCMTSSSSPSPPLSRPGLSSLILSLWNWQYTIYLVSQARNPGIVNSFLSLTPTANNPPIPPITLLSYWICFLHPHCWLPHFKPLLFLALIIF